MAEQAERKVVWPEGFHGIEELDARIFTPERLARIERRAERVSRRIDRQEAFVAKVHSALDTFRAFWYAHTTGEKVRT
jgi:hypothetical protein